MSHVPMEELTEKVDSKYRLVIIAARRSRQLNQGVRPLVQTKAGKPTYIALDELAAGRIEYEVKPLEEVAKEEVFAEAVKPMWFREIAPEGVVAEEETEGEEVQELEAIAPAETEAEETTEEEVPEEVEGELVGLDQLEKADEVEEET
ncbi:MAG: DNA-directed RNA polymerase subunit omega [Candidatus Methylomirabilales bacterium]